MATKGYVGNYAIALIETAGRMLSRGREWLTEAKAPDSAGGSKITLGEIGNFFMIQLETACEGFGITKEEYLQGVQEKLTELGLGEITVIKEKTVNPQPKKPAA